MFNIEDLLQWKRYQDRKHELFMLQQQMMQVKEQMFIRKWVTKKSVKPNMFIRNRMTNSVKSNTDVPNNCGKSNQKNITEEPRKKVQNKNKDNLITKSCMGKKPDCWHYVRGHCKRGKYCKFTHDNNLSYPDTHKIFLGGLPLQTTETSLCQHLKEMGFNVINKPKVYRGFSPQVCLESEDEAKSLIEKGSITIEGMIVNVRSYQPFTKKNQEKLQEIGSRSVFLSGLRKGTTTQMIKKELEAIGMEMVNYPLIKDSICPQVTMATEKQAQSLVSMVKIEINGHLVYVRPYTMG